MYDKQKQINVSLLSILQIFYFNDLLSNAHTNGLGARHDYCAKRPRQRGGNQVCRNRLDALQCYVAFKGACRQNNNKKSLFSEH